MRQTSLNNYNVIQASRDSMVNISAFAQILDYYAKNPNADKGKSFYLERTQGASFDNANEAIRNGFEIICGKSNETKQYIDRMIDMLGGITKFKLYPASPARLGGFTKNETEKFVTEKILKNDTAKAYLNSLVEGVPFTFGINLNNTRISQPEKSSFDFLTSGYLGVPTGATLFGSSEILNLIEFNGHPTDITNGATDIPTTSVRGTQELVPYNVIGIQIPELTNVIDNTGRGFAGDNLLKSLYGNALEVTEAKMKTTLMRIIYKRLSELKGPDGKPLVPTYTLNDIDTTFNNKKLKDLFASSAGLGEFLTKVLPALWAPSNKFLDANQNILKRIVAPTSASGAVANTTATLGFTGQTQGQVPVRDNLYNMMNDLEWYFGGDILPETDSADFRMLFVADPKFSEFDSAQYSALWVSMALAPTIMATSAHIGFTNQVFVSKFSDPMVTYAKRLMFLS